MAAETSEDSITVKDAFGLGPVTARGASVFLGLIIVAMGYFLYQESNERSREHVQMTAHINETARGVSADLREEIAALRTEISLNRCINGLNLFQQLLVVRKGEPITWQNVPVEYYPCMPRWATERQK